MFIDLSDLLPELTTERRGLGHDKTRPARGKRAGDIAKAKEYYKKAISMDPDGYVGNNARVMLRKIEMQGH